MNGDGRKSNFPKPKQVILPSGMVLDLTHVGESPAAERPSAEAAHDLHICVGCTSNFVYPARWEEAGPEHWTVLLHCPNCDLFLEGVFSQVAVERFDEELDRGADQLGRDYRRLREANMAEEVDRFARALEADAILPEDF
jgi:hypothetical protein